MWYKKKVIKNIYNNNMSEIMNNIHTNNIPYNLNSKNLIIKEYKFNNCLICNKFISTNNIQIHYFIECKMIHKSNYTNLNNILNNILLTNSNHLNKFLIKDFIEIYDNMEIIGSILKTINYI